MQIKNVLAKDKVPEFDQDELSKIAHRSRFAPSRTSDERRTLRSLAPISQWHRSVHQLAQRVEAAAMRAAHFQ
jgi:hypothetical protein